MTKTDILIKLIISAKKNDMVSFEKYVETLIAVEKSKNHYILADRLSVALNSTNKINSVNSVGIKSPAKDLIFELNPQKKFDDLIINDISLNVCKDLIAEQQNIDLLKPYGIYPRNRILLTGESGNGKTSLAEAISTQLNYPLFVIRYDNLIKSYLGQTAKRLNDVFDFVKTKNCVLFFDEFDMIGKERNDINEAGEIKRVVNSLLLQIDRLPSNVIIIAASNHQELLDKAIRRRFQIKLNLGRPNKLQIEMFVKKIFHRTNIKFDYNIKNLAEELIGLSFANIEEFCLDVCRYVILNHQIDNIKDIIPITLKQIKG